MTPMMRQYLEIKERCLDAILFFRLGDFYEMFFEDAVVASKILEITLTTRNKNDANPVPLCGIPYHAASSYISKLIAHGKKVAICEQVEDPRSAKGIVKRDIVQVISPGLVIDDQNLSAKDSNYLAALAKDDHTWGLAFLDLSTGDFRVTEIGSGGNNDSDALLDELIRIDPREFILPETVREEALLADEILAAGASVTWLDEYRFDFEKGEGIIREQFGIQSLDGLGCGNMTAGIGAAGAILAYIREMQGSGGRHIDRLKP